MSPSAPVASGEPPLVSLAGVSKRYGGGPPVLEDVTLAVGRGEFVSFVGPSGCGKSTLLKLIASLTPVTAGELAVAGRTPEAAREEMAFIFQEATLLPWLDVTKNIELPLRLRGVPPAQRARLVAEMRHLVALDHVAHFYPRQLSGGMKMRVSIARALALTPKILLLDEPFGALDELSRDRLNEELLAIRAQQGFTGFFVTHSVAEAVFLSTRIVVLSAHPGRVHRDVPVPLAWPRTAETRETDAYQHLVAELSRELRLVARATQPAARRRA